MGYIEQCVCVCINGRSVVTECMVVCGEGGIKVIRVLSPEMKDLPYSYNTSLIFRSVKHERITCV